MTNTNAIFFLYITIFLLPLISFAQNNRTFSIVASTVATSDNSNLQMTGSTHSRSYLLSLLYLSNNFNSKDLVISPNPTTQNILITNNSSEVLTFHIFSFNGALEKYGSLKRDSNTISISELVKGIHYIVFNLNGSHIVKKIIKQ